MARYLRAGDTGFEELDELLRVVNEGGEGGFWGGDGIGWRLLLL